MTELSLQDWLQRIEQYHPAEIELGLDRVQSVWEKILRQHSGAANSMVDKPTHESKPGRLADKVVTVAGTNGKGSTIALLQALAIAQGLRCGAYTSPHLEVFNERIRIDGVNVADTELCDAFAAVDKARNDIALTYFEFTTLAAFVVFMREKLDLVLLEVGLGGRLDAVNIYAADVTVITSIALDHQAWLGNDRDAIALEKAGILRAEAAFVCGERVVPDSLQAYTADLQMPQYYIGKDFDYLATGAGDAAWQWQLADRRPLPLPAATIYADNVATALMAAQLVGLELSEAVTARCVSELHVAGRWQSLQFEERQLLLDAAHNPAAVEVLVQHLAQTPVAGRTHAVFAVMHDKDWPAMLQAALPEVDSWFLSEIPTNARAEKTAKIADWLREQDVGMISVSKNPRQALRRAVSISTESDRILVFGSFYLLAPLLSMLKKSAARAAG